MVLIDMEMPKRCKECWFMDRKWCSAKHGKLLDGDYRYGIKDKPSWCPLKPFTPPDPQITTSIDDQEEIYHNGTVQLLRNSMTGDASRLRWWKKKEEEE